LGFDFFLGRKWLTFVTYCLIAVHPETDEELLRWKRRTSFFAQMPRNIDNPWHTMWAIQTIQSPIDANDPINAEAVIWTACE
jgi:hypothetical protein